MVKTLVSNEKLNKADWCIVDQVEMRSVWYLLWAERPRIVTRYLVRFGKKICMCFDCRAGNFIGQRRMTEFETTMFEVGDQLAYTLDYKDGEHC